MLIKSIYVYLISAVTLIMSVVGGINFVSNALSLATFTGYVETYEDFVRNRCTNYGDPLAITTSPIAVDAVGRIKATSIATPAAPTCNVQEAIVDPVWKERYQTYVDDMKASDKRQKLDRMLKAIPLILIPLPVFFLFQKKRKDL
ncbi:MAG TPA: hypothetical protein VGE63_00235 [Candidatus Paceibacterota bacterium]